MIGGLLGGLLLLLGNNQDKKVTPEDIEKFIVKKIAAHEKTLETKKASLTKLQEEIEVEQRELTKYKYAREHLDLKMIADEINSERKIGG